MKLSTIIMLACCLQLSARTFSQTVTYTSSSASLPNVFKVIKQQTGYVVFYDQSVVDNLQPVSLDAKDQPVEAFIKAALKGTSLNYYIQDKTIVISKKSAVTALIEQMQAAAPQPVSGKLVDQSGYPIMQATITLQPSGRYTYTNAEGVFYFDNVAPGKYILSATHISFGKVEKKIQVEGAPVSVSVTMQVAAHELGGVEIGASTGYQKIDPAKSTGAYVVVRASDLEKNPSLDLNAKLAGLIPGVRFDLSKNKIQIRGDNSFQAGSTPPLIVIDGFPAIDQNLAGYPGIPAGGSLGGALIANGSANLPLNNNTILSVFNPADIESITFLKDAAAASIWGSKAANGVIVIETKKGVRGRTALNINSTLTVSDLPDMKNLNMMNSRQYIDLEKELFNNGYYAADPSSYWRYQNVSEAVTDMFAQKSGKISQAELDSKLETLSQRSNLNQIRDVLLQRALAQQYNLSLSGGGDNSSYYISGNYTSNKPVFRNNTSNNYSVLANLTNSFFKNRLNITTGLNLVYGDRKVNNAAQEALGGSNFSLRPYDMLLDENGRSINRAIDFTPHIVDSFTNAGYLPWYYNVSNQLQSSNAFTNTNTRITEQMRGRITDWLTVDASGMYQRNVMDMNALQKQNSYYVTNLINTGTTFTGTKPVYGVPLGNILTTSHLVTNDYSLRGQFNVNKTWNRIHQLNMIGGSEIRQSSGVGYGQAHYGFNEDTYQSSAFINPYKTIFNSTVNAISQNTSLVVSKMRYLSYFGNASYGFMNRYYISGSLRFDDYNLLGVARRKRATPLWSGGLKWNMKDEKFLQNVKWINNLSLRASLGTGGTVPSQGTPFALISFSPATPNYQPQTGASVIQPANPDLTWSTTRTLNFGLDVAAFNGRLMVTADVYNKRTTGIFVNLPINSTYGFSTRAFNAANMSAHGIELNITGTLMRTRDFTWSSNFNITYSTSKITDNRFPNTITSASSSNIIATGYPVDNLFLYRWAGLDNKGQSQIYDAQHNIIPSTTTTSLKTEDLVYAGRTTPAYFGGFSMDFRYKQFTLAATSVYNMGYKVLKSDISNNFYPSAGNGPGFMPTSKAFVNRWQKPGDEAFTNVPGILNNNFTSINRYLYSTVNLMDGGNVRLQLVSLTYALSSDMLKRIKVMKGLSVGASASNLGLIWRANKEHRDPDYMFAGSYTGWAPPKSYNLNLNVTF